MIKKYSYIKRLLATSTLIICFNLHAEENNDDLAQASILDERAEAVNEAISNPFAFSQHRLNYILPFSYVSNPTP